MGNLLQSQRNHVFAAVRDAGFDPSDFEWDRDALDAGASASIDVLRHPTSGGFFEFRHVGRSKANRFAPGEDVAVSSNNPGSWELQLAYVRRWLEYLKREIEAPDLWGETSKERELVDAARGEGSNEPFTEDERGLISRQLRELKEYLVASYELNAGQQAILEDRIRYLDEATGRQGRDRLGEQPRRRAPRPRRLRRTPPGGRARGAPARVAGLWPPDRGRPA